MKNTISCPSPRGIAACLLAAVFLVLGPTAGAQARAAKKNNSNPELVAAYMDSARFYFEQGKMRRAYRYFKKVYKKFPDCPEAPAALRGMAKTELERGRHMRAYEFYDSCLVKYPKADGYGEVVSEIFKIGNIYLGTKKRSGRYKSSAMRKAVKIFDSLKLRTLDNDMAVKVLYNSGIGSYRVENFQSALDSLERIPVERTTIKDDVCYLICRCYYELAERGRNNQIPVNNALKMIPSYMEKLGSEDYAREVAGLLAEVEDMKAKHFAGIAHFYSKTKHKDAAEIYRRKIVTQFPATAAAAKVGKGKGA